MIQSGTSLNGLIGIIYIMYVSHLFLDFKTKRSVKRDIDCFILLK